MAKSTKRKSKKLDELREKSQKRRLEKVKKFSEELVKKLGDKVMCVVVYGSVSKKQHTAKSDIDTFIVLDDTKLKEDVPSDIREKIRFKVGELANEVDKRITLQYFTFLTEFWEALREGDPLLITVLRLGIPVYDVGVFMPAKRLLQRGKILATKEAVDKRMQLAIMGYNTVEKRMKLSVPHYLEQAMASAGQAPIMMLGRTPPAKEEVPEVLEEMFVKNELLEPEFVKIAQDIHDFAKSVEKNQSKVTGVLIDEYLDKTQKFINRMGKLIEQLGHRRRIKSLVDEYKTFLKANVAFLKSKGIEPPEDKNDLPKIVAEHTTIGESYLKLFEKWESLIQKIKEKNLKKVNEKEIYELKNETRNFVSYVGKELRKMKYKELGTGKKGGSGRKNKNSSKKK